MPAFADLHPSCADQTLEYIVFAFVLVVSSNAVVKIVAEAGNVADKWMTVVSQMGFNNITSSPAPATW